MSGAIRVLIVDDEAIVSRMLKEVLVDSGFEVVGQAVDGVEGVALARSLEPDAILLDIKMPRVNGFEVLSWMKQQPSLASLRVLVLTSSADLRDVNEAYRLGANSFLVKPLDFQDFTSLSRLINDFWLGASKAPEVFRPPRPKPNGRDNPTNGKNIS